MINSLPIYVLLFTKLTKKLVQHEYLYNMNFD